jgi:hypothetical protein
MSQLREQARVNWMKSREFGQKKNLMTSNLFIVT